jgi:hypothetical protein
MTDYHSLLTNFANIDINSKQCKNNLEYYHYLIECKISSKMLNCRNIDILLNLQRSNNLLQTISQFDHILNIDKHTEKIMNLYLFVCKFK